MNAAALLALQEIDTALDAIANRRPRLAEVAANGAAAGALAELRRQQQAVGARITAAEAAIEAAEAAAHQLTTKRTRLEGQLKTVIAPREAEALMSEIATLNAQRGELDDQELAALDEQAAAEAELAQLQAAQPAVEAEAAAAAAALAAANTELDAAAADLRQRRETAVAALTAAELTTYERARTQHGGTAVARLEGHRCTGCHLDLSPAEIDTVKATPPGDLAECPQCARFIAR